MKFILLAEAWILSQPKLLPREAAKNVANLAARPETVNFNRPPSKRLNEIYNARISRSYNKTTNGKALFQKLDPAVAAGKCPRLSATLDEMLRLARSHQ